MTRRPLFPGSHGCLMTLSAGRVADRKERASHPDPQHLIESMDWEVERASNPEDGFLPTECWAGQNLVRSTGLRVVRRRREQFELVPNRGIVLHVFLVIERRIRKCAVFVPVLVQLSLHVVHAPPQ